MTKLHLKFVAVVNVNKSSIRDIHGTELH